MVYEYSFPPPNIYSANINSVSNDNASSQKLCNYLGCYFKVSSRQFSDKTFCDDIYQWYSLRNTLGSLLTALLKSSLRGNFIPSTNFVFLTSKFYGVFLLRTFDLKQTPGV